METCEGQRAEESPHPAGGGQKNALCVCVRACACSVCVCVHMYIIYIYNIYNIYMIYMRTHACTHARTHTHNLGCTLLNKKKTLYNSKKIILIISILYIYLLVK